MKILNIAALGLLATVAFTSCEMKEELYGGKDKGAEQGTLELGVTVKQPFSMSRAETVSTDNFPVTIEGNQLDNTLEYTKASEVPTLLTLPVGDYKVSAHSPIKLEKQMTEPYYAGEGNYTVKAGANEVATVTCKMKNTRIQLAYGDNFLSSFKNWTITIAAGTNNALEYTTASSSPAPVYLNIEEEKIESIVVNVTATTNKGVSVVDSKTFVKGDATEKYTDVNNWFEGGDAITINMGAMKPSTGNVTGITINAKVSFENKNDEVVIDPSEGETPVVPETPDATALTLTLPEDVTFSLASETKPSAVAVIKAPATLKSMMVKIVPGNKGFGEALALTSSLQLNFTEGDGVDLIASATNVNALFEMVGKSEVKAPTTDLTTYNFPIDAFFGFLTDATTGNGESPHQFIIKVVDDNDKEVSGIFKVNITE